MNGRTFITSATLPSDERPEKYAGRHDAAG